MAETGIQRRARKIRHRGRDSQILIYLGKQLRFFINQNDWKVLPMAAIIAALVSMVIRKRLFVNMEGSLIGAFALVCVGIWNGCFNSIQSVCRERPIIKREHRSGMHISAYVAAHMIYQLFLCTAQTALTLYVMKVMNISFPEKGFITPWIEVDIGISLLLITYASDMMSLLLSSIAHTTTSAMTIMPFVLIFQLVFSGGLIPLPEWTKPLSNYTISNYGIRVLAAQSGYNERPMMTGWDTINSMRNSPLDAEVTLGQALDLLESPAVEKYRDTVLLRIPEPERLLEILDGSEPLRETTVLPQITVAQLIDGLTGNEVIRQRLQQTVLLPSIADHGPVTALGLLETLRTSEDAAELMQEPLNKAVTAGDVLDLLKRNESLWAGSVEGRNITVGDLIDFAKGNKALQAHRDLSFSVHTTVGELLELFGEERVKDLVLRKTTAAAYREQYALTRDNVYGNWAMLGVFIFVFALLAVLVLKQIDHDKR